ncbi:endocuticle structural glycoprotein SgAbd-2 [Orussus abietinus]|uniref:endocuticle structural glycoprotein SgAbd-2 n=1 Tax=Orussus abietinus TaxID=222816 RepID=UPI000626D8BA|nr:endocuticle structural glycoprotein SgAbd-2 [Orussus abietinus]
MYFVIVLLAVVGCALGQYGGFRGFPNQNALPQTTRPQFQQPQYQPQYSGPRGPQIKIRSQYQDISPDGSYSWSYETENGISASETGTPKAAPEGQAEVVQGQYSYTAPDGTPISVQYIADENGFRPQGAHLPTPPPIPEAIRRALAANPPRNDNSYDQDNRPYRPSYPTYGNNFRRF